MKFIETIKLALAAVWAHKLRSALTLLGMIIGVTAVVVVVSMIQGFNTYVDEKIAEVGAPTFSIYRFDFFRDFQNTDTIAAATRRNKELTLDDMEFLRERASLADQIGARVAPTALRMPISFVRSVTDTSMIFITPIPPIISATNETDVKTSAVAPVS